MMSIMIAAVVIAIFIWLQIWARWMPSPLVTARPIERVEGAADPKKLFVLIHGYRSQTEQDWRPVRDALRPHGDLLSVTYPAHAVSNANAEKVSLGVSEVIEKAQKVGGYDKIVLVGHSMGALIARKAFLYGVGGTNHRRYEEVVQPAAWAAKVERIVLLAGMNRGWDISGKKPMDMKWDGYLEWWLGSSFAELTGMGSLIMEMQTGSPFVANLRLEWIYWNRKQAKAKKPPLLVVQLLGDIDDMVSDADNTDLSTVGGSFVFLRVRGSGHASILDFDARQQYSRQSPLGEYREKRFLLAAIGEGKDVMSANNVLPPPTDGRLKHLVFVLHGIRDYGEWSASFETALNSRFVQPEETDPPSEKPKEKKELAIVPLRYGYFGMGPFLLRTDRQKYVRWFMDEYTETIARYPNIARDPSDDAELIDFVGHSNGTYLLTSALKRYRSLRVRRVVFGGSVVRKDYDWSSMMSDVPNAKRDDFAQVQKMRNYVAADDWVVGLLPRFFEPAPMCYLNDDLGSAGFNGFDDSRVDNIRFITGSHGAFLHHIPVIADFLFSPDDNPDPRESNKDSVYLDDRQGGHRFLEILSDWGCGILWASAVLLVVSIGFIARQMGLLYLVAYILALIVFLCTY